MKYNDFSTLFYNVCEIKEKVVRLQSEELRKFKQQFFSLNFPTSRLRLLWEFIWDDRTFEDVYFIFRKKKLIEKAGENHVKK